MSVEWIYRDDLHQVSSGGLEMKTVSGAQVVAMDGSVAAAIIKSIPSIQKCE